MLGWGFARTGKLRLNFFRSVGALSFVVASTLLLMIAQPRVRHPVGFGFLSLVALCLVWLYPAARRRLSPSLPAKMSALMGMVVGALTVAATGPLFFERWPYVFLGALGVFSGGVLVVVAARVLRASYK